MATSSNEANLIMTRATLNSYDKDSMDRTILLNLELRRQERRRNLRYRTSLPLLEESTAANANQRDAGSSSKLPRPRSKTADEYAKELEQWLKKMKCTGVTGIRLDSFSDIKVGINQDPLDIVSSPSLEPYPNLWEEDFKYKGYKDEQGRAKGRAVIELDNGDVISGL